MSRFGTGWKHRRFCVLTCSVALLLAILVGCGGDQPEGPPAVRPVKTMVLDSGASATRHSYPGMVQASKRATLAFKVSGPLVEFPVKEGDEVEQGTTLAQIDPHDFEIRLDDTKSVLAEAKATLKAMRSSRPEDVRIVESQLAAATSDYQRAVADALRIESLVTENVLSQSELEQSTTARDIAKARMEMAAENLKIAKNGARPEDIEAMEAKIEGFDAQVKIAQTARDDTELTAPFSGVVARAYVENHENVAADQSILLLQGVEEVDVVIDVPQSVAASARKDGRAKMVALFESLPDHEFELELAEFSTEADPATQTYQATLRMPRPDRSVGINILSGMSCNVLIDELVSGDEGAVQFNVPAAAVFDVQGKQYAWVVDDSDVVHRRQVEVGSLTGAEDLRVTTGLELDETIAISGVHHLREGMKVRKLGRQIGDQLK